MVFVSGWFESESGAVMFEASGSGLFECAMQMVKKFGGDAVGVDREADVESADFASEAMFWRAYDRAVDDRKRGAA